MSVDIENLPGYAKAKELGYELSSYAGNGETAYYVKADAGGNVLSLTVWVTGQAELTANWRAVGMSCGVISWPNKNFPTFEKQLLSVLQSIAHCKAGY